MAEKTEISWTDATFNPWWGCQKVSPACDHCYAERDAKRHAPGRVLWGVGSERRTFEDKHWAGPMRMARREFFECGACGARGGDRAVGYQRVCKACGSANIKPARIRVFCASMADWLDLDAPLDQFVRLLATIRSTPELDWLLLSKRIGNWHKRLTEAQSWALHQGLIELHSWIGVWLDGAPPTHVVVMSTVINQEEADRDVAKLRAVPARRRGLSIEPMLGAVDLVQAGAIGVGSDDLPPYTGRSWGEVDWVIAGGESGPHARPSHPDWFRRLRDQCDAAGVPFHFKQWGEWAPDPDDDRGVKPIGLTRAGEILRDNASFNARTGDAELMFRIGKKAAGRLLDGVEHNEFPEAL